MTEEEAKTKWCPYQEIRLSMVASTLANIISRWPNDAEKFTKAVNENRNCIASGCMMWRTTLHGTEGKVYEGYCGLSGKP